MNKVFWQILVIVIFLLTACGQSTPIPIIDNATSTPSPLPTATQTVLPSATPTASITPLPTIPTFTPTFDVSTIVTVTPAPKAECPKEDPSVIAKFATPNSDGSYEIYSASDILDYLNSGGTATQLRDSGLGEIIDLNRDGVSEVVYTGLFRNAYIILGCKDGTYQNLLHFGGDSGAGLADTLDLNKNGMPEVILNNFVHYGYVDISIFEWDGNKYHSLIQVPYYNSTEFSDWVSATENPKFMDIDKDGLKEIVLDFYRLCGGFGDFCDGTPRRQETTILAWNGQNYVTKQSYYATAQYRFQAIQDADREVMYGNYDIALNNYQQAAFSNKLKWWSKERRDYEVNIFYDSYKLVTPTPLPYPTEDKSEYPKLAAYAYYRIMLIHLVQGRYWDADTDYDALQQWLGSDLYARPYVEMATAFWNAYKSTHKMYDGCGAAIQYAAENPDLLIPLGSDYHGSQAKIYKPEDVCPFR